MSKKLGSYLLKIRQGDTSYAMRWCRTQTIYQQNIWKKLFIFSIIFILNSCTANKAQNTTPSWYISPKQNDFENLYGAGEGHSLEEATKYALADAASRLIVNISSTSSLLREENQNSVNEEMRIKVKQSVENISFSDFRVTKSNKIAQTFFVEIQIERTPFIKSQKERIAFLKKKISDLNLDSLNKNQLQRRNALIKILDLSKELELSSRIIAGSGENINLNETLAEIAKFQNQFDRTSDKIEFYFANNSAPQITQIIKKTLNREKIKVTPIHNPSSLSEITLRINSSSRSNKIYEAFITKIEINFENFSEGKLLASNIIEISGSSTISEAESYSAALKSLEEKINQDGILKIIGIIN